MFAVLLVGRLFCGVATSLLYSAFESWLVAEHFKVGVTFSCHNAIALLRAALGESWMQLRPFRGAVRRAFSIEMGDLTMHRPCWPRIAMALSHLDKDVLAEGI